MEALRSNRSPESKDELQPQPSWLSEPDYAAIGRAVCQQVSRILERVQRYVNPQQRLQVANRQLAPTTWWRGYFRTNGLQVDLHSDRDGSQVWVVMTDDALELNKTFMLADGQLDEEALDYLTTVYTPVTMRYDSSTSASSLAVFAQIVQILLALELPAVITELWLPPCEYNSNGRATIGDTTYEIPGPHGTELLVRDITGTQHYKLKLTRSGQLTADSTADLTRWLQNQATVMADPAA